MLWLWPFTAFRPTWRRIEIKKILKYHKVLYLLFIFHILLKCWHLGGSFLMACALTVSVLGLSLLYPPCLIGFVGFFLNWCFVFVCFALWMLTPFFSPPSPLQLPWLFRALNIPPVNTEILLEPSQLRKATWTVQASSGLFSPWFICMTLWLNVWILESGKPRFDLLLGSYVVWGKWFNISVALSTKCGYYFYYIWGKNDTPTII